MSDMVVGRIEFAPRGPSGSQGLVSQLAVRRPAWPQRPARTVELGGDEMAGARCDAGEPGSALVEVQLRLYGEHFTMLASSAEAARLSATMEREHRDREHIAALKAELEDLQRDIDARPGTSVSICPAEMVSR